MKTARPLAIGLACAAMAFAPLAAPVVQAQSLPRLPKPPKLPSMPRLPTGSTDAPASTGTASVQAQRADPQQVRAYNQAMGKLQAGINVNWGSPADNARIDGEVREYRALVDRLASGEFDSLPDSQKSTYRMMLAAQYDTAAATVDREISWGEGMITGHGRADAGYNYLLGIETQLYGAKTLYPEKPEYAAAHAKALAVLGKYGNRSAAIAAEDAAEIAAARNVRMPAAISTDPAAVAQFRQAWQTSGIPWPIVKIHITSGWRDKTEYGRVIGQNRDAAIVARNPDNPNHCNLYDFTMFKDRSGAVRRGSHSTKRIACENVPK